MLLALLRRWPLCWKMIYRYTLAHWVRKNGLKLNENKTQVIMLSRKGRVKELESIKVTLSEVEILKHRSVRCLGVTIAEGLDTCLERGHRASQKEVFLSPMIESVFI